MNLAEAEALAQQIIDAIRHFCDKIQVAGSVRRKRPDPKDIDIVLARGQLADLHRKLEKALDDHEPQTISFGEKSS